MTAIPPPKIIHQDNQVTLCFETTDDAHEAAKRLRERAVLAALTSPQPPGWQWGHE